tara:strand:+ start:881 stop:1147 length:267 start_codon:yes stop_codon:yes gene_type:complete
MNKSRIATTITSTDENGETTVTDYGVDWDMIRWERNQELNDTDWWAVADRTMSDAERNYRTFLRNLPQNYSTPEEAQTAWLAYDVTGL